MLIGGHAIILYGIPRFTRDIDLCVPDTHEKAWRAAMRRLGYRFVHGTNAFLQFTGDSDAMLPPVDMMLVDTATWEKLLANARRPAGASGPPLDVPAPEHLVAMKLQAAASPHRRTGASDWSDVAGLVHACAIDLDDPAFRAIVEKFGGASAWPRLKHELER